MKSPVVEREAANMVMQLSLRLAWPQLMIPRALSEVGVPNKPVVNLEKL